MGLNAVAVLNKNCVVFFNQDTEDSMVDVYINFSDLPQNRTFAIHIHEYGDLRDGCHSLGGHWNPNKVNHGSFIFPQKPRHAGDLINNIFTDDYGRFEFSYMDPLLTLYGNESIIGRSVVVHDGEDDLGLGGTQESLTTGNAGGRMMCGIIGRSKGKF